MKGAAVKTSVIIRAPRAPRPGDLTAIQRADAGIVPRTAPPAGTRTVAPGCLLIDSLLGSVQVQLDGPVVPSGGELVIEEIEMVGREVMLGDGAVMLRRLQATVTIDQFESGQSIEGVVSVIDSVATLGLPVRLYGPVPNRHLPWRLAAAPTWSEVAQWRGGQRVRETAVLSFVEHRPVSLLSVASGTPGQAAKKAKTKAKTSKTKKAK